MERPPPAIGFNNCPLAPLLIDAWTDDAEATSEPRLEGDDDNDMEDREDEELAGEEEKSIFKFSKEPKKSMPAFVDFATNEDVDDSRPLELLAR